MLFRALMSFSVKMIGTPLSTGDDVNDTRGNGPAYYVAPSGPLTQCLKSTGTEQQTHTERNSVLTLPGPGSSLPHLFCCMARMITNVFLLCPPFPLCVLHSLARALPSKLHDKVMSPSTNHPEGTIQKSSCTSLHLRQRLLSLCSPDPREPAAPPIQRMLQPQQWGSIGSPASSEDKDSTSLHVRPRTFSVVFLPLQLPSLSSDQNGAGVCPYQSCSYSSLSPSRQGAGSPQAGLAMTSVLHLEFCQVWLLVPQKQWRLNRRR